MKYDWSEESFDEISFFIFLFMHIYKNISRFWFWFQSGCYDFFSHAFPYCIFRLTPHKEKGSLHFTMRNMTAAFCWCTSARFTDSCNKSWGMFWTFHNHIWGAVHNFLAPTRFTEAQLVFKEEGSGSWMSHTANAVICSLPGSTTSVGLFGQYVDSDLVNNYYIIFRLNRAWNECLYSPVNIFLW